jgi:wyosine [tRNA(Phe)-imidazoG37] synthetase (radical SAM superfamily)
MESNQADESNQALRTPIIGGPVCTRTADRSLHVNLMPTADRRCSFDCVYCPFPRGRRERWDPWPRPGDIGSAVANALNAHPAVESITISGAGEPTLHPKFGGVLAEVLSARRGWPDLPVRVVTNGTTCLADGVRRSLEFADERIVRIDAGGARVSRANMPVEPIAAALRKLPDFSVESIFVEGSEGNTSARDVDEWIARLASVHPRHVYVTTIAGAWGDPTVRVANAGTLERIAEQVRRRTGLLTSVIP